MRQSGLLGMSLAFALFGRAALAQELKPKNAPPQAPLSAAAKQFEALRLDYQQQLDGFQKVFDQAKTEADRDRLWRERFPPPETIYARFMTLAEKNPKDSAAIDALIWVATNSSNEPKDSKTQARALDQLQRLYLTSEKLPEVFASLPFDPQENRGEKFLRAVLEKNPHRDVQALACHQLATRRLAQVRQVTRWRNENPEKLKDIWIKSTAFAYLVTSDVPKLEREADLLLEHVIKNYGDVPTTRGRETTTLGKIAQGQLYALRYLAIGKRSPDLASVDLAGNPVRLSQLRGNVVVLDVWATWCGPCRAMIPHERELVKRCAGRPFALVSISVDAEKETLAKFLQKEAMPWIHWHNGDEGGVITALAIESYPTIYVLDSQGVIRFKDVRGKALDRAIDTLLKEVAPRGAK
jgi:thiol-disulfide isomerase/thioredoxin